MWRALVGLGQLGSGYLVLRVDTRENPGGKNGVITHMRFWGWTRILFNISLTWTLNPSPYSEGQGERLQYMPRLFNRKWKNYYKLVPCENFNT